MPESKKAASVRARPVWVTNSGYDNGGANRTRGTLKTYNPLKSSTAADIDVNLTTLRNRSSDLFCNSPIGAAALNTSRTNVIGAGLKLSPKIDYQTLGITAEEAKAWQRNTLKEFELWAGSTACDLYRKHNFFDMQDLTYLSYLIDGDAWAAIKYRRPLPNCPYSLRIQLFEASRVCNPDSVSAYGPLSYYNVSMVNPDNGNRIINGVEIDADGAVAAYWIANRVPFDLVNPDRLLNWTRVTAYNRASGRPNILQISHEERPEQYRGVPYLAPAIEVIKQVSRYTGAELTAAIIKSFFTLFFTSDDAAVNDINDVLNPAIPPETYESRLDKLQGIDLSTGSVNLLPNGIKVDAVDGARTMSTFEAFTNSLISQIGAALGISSEVMLSRFQSSYSAARGALLQAAAVFKARRAWFARDFCQPVYEAWLAEAVALGRVQAPGYATDPLLTQAWSRAEWFGPVMGMLDPVKEVEGAALRVKYGFSTGEREAAELTGSGYDDNIAQIAQEHSVWKANALDVPKADNTGGREVMKNEQEILAGEK